MPLYEYEDARTGGVVELVRAVNRRDRVPRHLRRRTAPSRIGVLTGVLAPAHPDRAVPRAFKDLEQTINHREIARQSGFTTEQIKNVWNI